MRGNRSDGEGEGGEEDWARNRGESPRRTLIYASRERLTKCSSRCNQRCMAERKAERTCVSIMLLPIDAREGKGGSYLLLISSVVNLTAAALPKIIRKLSDILSIVVHENLLIVKNYFNLPKNCVKK